jgi:hypothetical protein
MNMTHDVTLLHTPLQICNTCTRTRSRQRRSHNQAIAALNHKNTWCPGQPSTKGTSTQYGCVYSLLHTRIQTSQLHNFTTAFHNWTTSQTAQLHTFTTVKLHNCTTSQLHNFTAAQIHNCTTSHLRNCTTSPNTVKPCSRCQEVFSGWKQVKSVPRQFFTASDNRNYGPSEFVCNS